MSLTIAQLPSPNFNQRDPQVPLQFIVLHYTGMKNAVEALARLCDAQAEVSAHYVIEEQGKMTQLVPEAQRAWHAGKSKWGIVTDLNSASIGIELVNPGHMHGYRAFPAAQIAALKSLLRDIIQRHNLPKNAVLAHADIAPGRKEDPGEWFPWRELAAENIGLWPEVRAEDRAPASDGEVQAMLVRLGYDCPQTGDYDRATRAALLAFQRHYHQENLTGTPELETVARLRAVVRQAAACALKP